MTIHGDDRSARIRDVFKAAGIGTAKDRRPKTAKTAAKHARDALMHFRDLANDLEGSELVALDQVSAILYEHGEGRD